MLESLFQPKAVLALSAGTSNKDTCTVHDACPIARGGRSGQCHHIVYSECWLGIKDLNRLLVLQRSQMAICELIDCDELLEGQPV